ncbi:TRAP transporter large permease [Desulfitibacter alkalitolerans]|uniref:TRAP transporter large permease n=1 Tax=Desulfitibacter alkalitolerans TaxID=264641 RepID=UPI000487979B|nr:TRAP transporter large permease [Desulfitibacter alkalitolerans]
MIYIIFGSLIVLFALGIPIVYSLGVASLISLLYLGNVPLVVILQKMWSALDNFALLAIPLFVLTGGLMERGGVSRRIIAFAYAVIGKIAGGLGFVSISSSMLFAALSGSSPATVAAIGGMIIPSMKEKNYDPNFAAALHASAGSIGVIIPPSITMIIYAVIAEQSVGRLFLGGFIPGILIGLALMVVCYIISKRENYPREEQTSLINILKTFKDAILSLMVAVIVMGGILSGIATATEAAVLAVFYAFCLSFFVYKELSLKDVKDVLIETIFISAAVMGVMATAGIFGWILVTQQVPQMIAGFLMSITDSPIMVFMMINVVLLIIGTFLDTGAALIIFVPMLLPIAAAYGFDPIHFGVVTVINLAIGMATPPLGICLFVACRIAKIPLVNIVRPILPFLGAMILVLFLVTYFPQIILFLPNLMSR